MAQYPRDQPELEACPTEEGLMVTHVEYECWPEKQLVPSQLSPELLYPQPNTTPDVKPNAVSSSAPPLNRQRQRKIWIIVILAIFVVIAGIVVGVVLGTRKTSPLPSSSPPNETNLIPPPTATASTKPDQGLKIMANSGIAATGWRLFGKSYVRLFYQGKDAFIYYIGWDSSSNVWTAPKKVDDVGAMANSPLAACGVHNRGEDILISNSIEVEVYFKSPSGKIGGKGFEPAVQKSNADSISGYPFVASDASLLSWYWPVGVYQDKRSEIRQVWFSPKTLHFENRALSELGVVSTKRTALVILPMRALHPTGNVTATPDMKLIYRRDDGNIYEFNQWADRKDTKNKVLRGHSIGIGGTMAAFSTVRPGDINGALNSHLIYQADNGTIFWGSDTDESGWSAPKKDAVFGGADNPTSLACVTAAASTVPDVLLTSDTDLNRCYFQQQGQLVEVSFDGFEWTGPKKIPTL